MQTHDDFIKVYWKRKLEEEKEVLASNSKLSKEFKQYCNSKGVE